MIDLNKELESNQYFRHSFNQYRAMHPNTTPQEWYDGLNGNSFWITEIRINGEGWNHNSQANTFVKGTRSMDIRDALGHPDCIIANCYITRGVDNFCPGQPISTKTERSVVHRIEKITMNSTLTDVLYHTKTEGVIIDGKNAERRSRILSGGSSGVDVYDTTGKFYYTNGEGINLANTFDKKTLEHAKHIYSLRILGTERDAVVENFMKHIRFNTVNLLEIIERWPLALLTKNDVKLAIEAHIDSLILDADRRYEEAIRPKEKAKGYNAKKPSGISLEDYYMSTSPSLYTPGRRSSEISIDMTEPLIWPTSGSVQQSEPVMTFVSEDIAPVQEETQPEQPVVNRTTRRGANIGSMTDQARAAIDYLRRAHGRRQ